MIRRTRRLLSASPPLVALALALAACGSPATDNAVDTANVTVPTGNTAASIRDLPEGQRTAVFLRAIRDAGRQCQGVTKAVEVATAAGAPPTWQATCDDGGQWLVAIGADGIATVTNRTEVREAGGLGNAT